MAEKYVTLSKFPDSSYMVDIIFMENGKDREMNQFYSLSENNSGDNESFCIVRERITAGSENKEEIVSKNVPGKEIDDACYKKALEFAQKRAGELERTVMDITGRKPQMQIPLLESPQEKR